MNPHLDTLIRPSTGTIHGTTGNTTSPSPWLELAAAILLPEDEWNAYDKRYRSNRREDEA